MTATMPSPYAMPPLIDSSVTQGVYPVRDKSVYKSVGDFSGRISKFKPHTDTDKLVAESKHVFNAFIDGWIDNKNDGMMIALSSLFKAHNQVSWRDEYGDREFACRFCNSSDWKSFDNITHDKECPIERSAIIATRCRETIEIDEISYTDFSTHVEQKNEDSTEMIGMFMDFYDSMMKNDSDTVLAELATIITVNSMNGFYDGAGYITEVGTTTHTCGCCEETSEVSIDDISHKRRCPYQRMEEFLHGDVTAASS